DERAHEILTEMIRSKQDFIREGARQISKVLAGSIVLPGQSSAVVEQNRRNLMLSTLERMLSLRYVSFFQSLGLDQLRALARGCEEFAATEGQAIIKQGEISYGLYIIVEGTVRVERASENDQKVVLGRLGPSEVFGEISLLDEGVRTASVIAESPVLLLSIQRDALLLALEDDPQIAMTMLRTMAQRLRQNNELLQRKLSDQSDNFADHLS
ncbi:MAG: cyclic nucleotide-binding domain-containing protein, partial [Chloroflexi bacterium]|nr:cyclic nucleotide-binding domain-containing protein [Chloroflexota bacterium]